MTPVEMLRACANVLEHGRGRLSITHTSGKRFPFAGGDTELLNVRDNERTYSVSVARVLAHMAKHLRAAAGERHEHG